MTFDAAAIRKRRRAIPGRTHETCPIRCFREPDPRAGRRSRPVRERAADDDPGLAGADRGRDRLELVPPRRHRGRLRRRARRSRWRRSRPFRPDFWRPHRRRADPARDSRATSASATASTTSSGWTRPGIIGRARPARAPSPSSAPTASRASQIRPPGSRPDISTIRPTPAAGTTSLSQHNNTFLATGYVDLGTYAGFTPYVGAGVGLNMSFMQGSSSFVETRERPRLCGQSHEPRRLPLRLGQLCRAADQSAAEYPVHDAELEPHNQLHDLSLRLVARGRRRLPAQPERDARRRLPLHQRRRVQSARQSADRADREAAQRFSADPRRRPLRPAVAERIRRLDAPGVFRRPSAVRAARTPEPSCSAP